MHCLVISSFWKFWKKCTSGPTYLSRLQWSKIHQTLGILFHPKLDAWLGPKVYLFWKFDFKNILCSVSKYNLVFREFLYFLSMKIKLFEITVDIDYILHGKTMWQASSSSEEEEYVRIINQLEISSQICLRNIVLFEQIYMGILFEHIHTGLVNTDSLYFKQLSFDLMFKFPVTLNSYPFLSFTNFWWTLNYESEGKVLHRQKSPSWNI